MQRTTKADSQLKSHPKNVKQPNLSKEQEQSAKFLEKVLKRVDELRLENKSNYAARILERVLNQFPFSSDLYYYLGCCHFDQARITEALRNFSTAYFLEPENPDFILGVADTVLVLGWAKRGLKLIKKLLKKDERNFLGRLMFGRFLESQEKWQKALEQYQMIQDQQDHPSYLLIYGRLGTCLMNMNQVDRAIEYFDESLRLVSDDPEILFNRGICHGSQGQNTEALNDFEDLLKINPEDPEALAYSALYLFYQGNKLLAIARIEKAVEMAPDFPLVKEIRDEILNNDPPEPNSNGDDFED